MKHGVHDPGVIFFSLMQHDVWGRRLVASAQRLKDVRVQVSALLLAFASWWEDGCNSSGPFRAFLRSRNE